LLLFAAGMTIGYAEIRWPRLRLLNFPVSPALLLIVPAAVLLAFPAKLGEAQYFREWNSLLWIVAAAVVALCALAGSGNLSWIGRLGVLLGDASYSTYLFHQWAFQPLYQKLAPRIARWHLEGFSIPLYVCGFVLTANLLGIFLHLVLERPIAMLFQFLQRKFLQPLL
jgi:exopolysaccharide production protein ExoZ